MKGILVTSPYTNFGNHKISVLKQKNKRKRSTWTNHLCQICEFVVTKKFYMVTIHSTFELAAAERSYFFLIMMCQNREFMVTKIGMWYGYRNITFIQAAIGRLLSLHIIRLCAKTENLCSVGCWLPKMVCSLATIIINFIYIGKHQEIRSFAQRFCCPLE